MLVCGEDGAYEWQYGIGVPKGEVARSAAEAETIAKHIGMEQPRGEGNKKNS